MAEPSEDDIRQVCEFAGLDPAADRQLVTSALKANGGNVEAVLVAYYDGESKVCLSAFLSSVKDAANRL